MKVGDVVYQPSWKWVGGQRVREIRNTPVTAVGRTWAQTRFGRVKVKPNLDGSHDVDNVGYGAGNYAYTSERAIQLASWSNRATTHLQRLHFRTLTIDQLAQVLAIVAPDFEPIPKETP